METNSLSLDRFIEGLPFGILIVNPATGMIKTGNAVAFDLLEVQIEDVLTQSFDTIVADEEILLGFKQVISGETSKHNAVFEKNGKYIKCTIGAITGDSEEEGDSILVFVENVTNFKQLELLKQDFIQTILHRIRNPLTTLKTSLSIVNSLYLTSVSEEIREILDMSFREVNRLHVLINDLRNLFLIETGLANLDLEIETFPVTEILDRALDELSKLPSIDDESRKRIICDGDRNIRIKADFEKLKQVLFVLLKNACDFSPEKTPVEVNLSQDNNMVTIAIKDYGIGISEEAKPYLFTKFFREDNEITRIKEGNGLGLYIARSLVDFMKGTLYCESKKGSGSSFFISLPSE